MSRQRKSRRVGGGITAGAMVVAAVAVAFGTGFTASRAVLGDGGAWLSKGRTVTHVNAATGTPDATIAGDLVAEAGNQELVRSPEGVAVVDTAGSTVTTLDTTTMRAGATTPLPAGAASPRYVVAGRFGYLVGERSVQPVDPVNLQPLTAEPLSFGQVGGAVATAEGSLLVLDSTKGTVVEVDGVEARIPVVVRRDSTPEQLALTAVAGRPVVLDTGNGSVRVVRPDGSVDSPVRVEDLVGRQVDDVAVADPGADGSTAWLVDRQTGRLVGVDVDSGEVRSSDLGETGTAGGLQAPVVLDGRVYLADAQHHRVTVVDGNEDELVQSETHTVDGRSDRLEVFAEDGRVWINDPAAQKALVAEPDGDGDIRFREVDKGTGDGVEERADDELPADAAESEPTPGDDDTPAASREPGPSPEPDAPDAPTPAPVETQNPPPDAPPAAPPGPPDADVPDVVGLDRDAACARITSARLACDARPSHTAPPGTEQDAVFRQDPTGGRLPQESPVVVDYFSPDPVQVPPVEGIRVAQGGPPEAGPACQAIVSAGLVCDLAPVAAVAGQAADQVLTQDPAADTTLVPGETVTVTYAPTALVPALSGDYNAACALVTALNLVCVAQDAGVGATPGQVVDQTPPAGTPVEAGSSVAPPVVVSFHSRRPVVPNVVGLNQTDACAALALERLGCSWELNTNSIRNPGLADFQSPAPGSDASPDQVVSVYHPAGPDLTLYRFQALTNGQAIEQWALNTSQSGPGRPADWTTNGTVGRCYSTQVEGSIPLYGFERPSPDDPNHEDHFYAANNPADPGQYQRAVDNYGQPEHTWCYVVPWNMPGAQMVTEWWKGQDAHFYNVNETAPGAGYTQVFGHWMTWP